MRMLPALVASTTVRRRSRVVRCPGLACSRQAVTRWERRGSGRARSAAGHELAAVQGPPAELPCAGTAGDIAQERFGLGKDGKTESRWYELFAESVLGRLRRIPQDADYPIVHQVLGWPRPVQYSPVFGCDQGSSKAAYRLLLQLEYDSDLRFDIGDGGSLYVTGKPADLRAGRWARLCAEFQEG